MNAIRQPSPEHGHSADQHAHSLRLRVFRMTRDRARAEDVVRESLLRSWRNREVVDPTGGSGRGWPLTLPKRIAIHQWRSASRQPLVLTDHVPKRAVGDTGQQAVDRQLVHAALRTLSIEHRQTLFETYFRGASVTQAAETLGVSPGTVKSRTHYALHALRQAIDRMGGAA